MDTDKKTDVAEQPEKMSDPQAASRTSPGQWALLGILLLMAVCSIAMVAELGSVISRLEDRQSPNVIINTGTVAGTGTAAVSTSEAIAVDNVPDAVVTFNRGENICAGKKPDLPNVECVVDAIVNVGPQAGANVTKGYLGGLEVDHVPITTPYWMNGMCPVNVHWHLGSEHLSVGEYDETGVGPGEQVYVDGGIDPGFRCKLYNESDPKFTKPFEWKHCVGMAVGETYEVHWPHSAAGACGTPNQYQTPFYDGVFCMDGVLTDTATQVGVQAQVFTIANDEQFFWPDLMRGMIVDGEKGQDIAKYTGSTTGSSRNNEICSQYSPITWQVDRKCHLISASTFDKMCADMKAQRDDMTLDLYAHGSRTVSDTQLVANNQHDRRLRRAAH